MSLGQPESCSTMLTMVHADDAAVLHQEGSPALRRVRFARLAAEAHRQGAVLSHEDLALLLALDASREEGRTIAETWPSGAVVTSTWGPDGRLLQQQDGTAVVVDYDYDSYGLAAGWELSTYNAGGVLRE